MRFYNHTALFIICTDSSYALLVKALLESEIRAATLTFHYLKAIGLNEENMYVYSDCKREKHR